MLRIVILLLTVIHTAIHAYLQYAEQNTKNKNRHSI